MRPRKSNRLLGFAVMSAMVAVPAVLSADSLASVSASANKPGVVLQVSPAGQSVEAGKVATYTVSVTSANGFAGTVTLAAGGLPPGATAAFQPTSLSLTAGGAGSAATSTLRVTTPASAQAKSYNLDIKGTSGKVSGAVTAGLTVNRPVSGSLSLTATPSTVTVPPGTVAVFTLSLARVDVPGNVAFSVQSGLPAGATAAFSPNPTPGTSVSLQVTTAETTNDGSYTLQLAASGQDAGGASRSASASVALVLKTNGKAFTISGDLAGQLSPGVSLPLALKVSNPNKKPITVENLSVSVQSVQRTAYAVSHGLTCPASDYVVKQYTGPYPLTVAGDSTRSLGELRVPSTQWPQLSLTNRPANQDGCKGATVTLAYTGSARGN